MGGYLRPSMCAATTFKYFQIVPSKATYFEKFTIPIKHAYIHTYCIYDANSYIF
jgi:hypothetical protein